MVVKFPYTLDTVESIFTVQIRLASRFPPYAIAQARNKSPGIKNVGALIDRTNGSRKIYGCGNRDTSGEYLRVSHFTGKLERHISAKREANQEQWAATVGEESLQNKKRITRQPRVIHRFGKLLGPTARPHIQAMDAPAPLQCCLRNACDVTRVS